jgi:hypothetical protein
MTVSPSKQRHQRTTAATPKQRSRAGWTAAVHAAQRVGRRLLLGERAAAGGRRPVAAAAASAPRLTAAVSRAPWPALPAPPSRPVLLFLTASDHTNTLFYSHTHTLSFPHSALTVQSSPTETSNDCAAVTREGRLRGGALVHSMCILCNAFTLESGEGGKLQWSLCPVGKCAIRRTMSQRGRSRSAGAAFIAANRALLISTEDG